MCPSCSDVTSPLNRHELHDKQQTSNSPFFLVQLQFGNNTINYKSGNTGWSLLGDLETGFLVGLSHDHCHHVHVRYELQILILN